MCASIQGSRLYSYSVVAYWVYVDLVLLPVRGVFAAILEVETLKLVKTAASPA